MAEEIWVKTNLRSFAVSESKRVLKVRNDYGKIHGLKKMKVKSILRENGGYTISFR